MKRGVKKQREKRMEIGKGKEEERGKQKREGGGRKAGV
jgi:hypothetical protein